ncbi:hypothetical protein EES43_14925 [Streptomyces sp. ADI96-02]|uniref:hypothetical protein n=1 Tax=Streptomyces sp. ADI96-02 TaxID=1522760 RepID=UPI000FB413A8|nr:hypothetical protein [Streptomyces sp. ADI96-02]RPK61899.1 hypothetical protein EES43_14925 [Streptomyces sp. ADI96-02]
MNDVNDDYAYRPPEVPSGGGRGRRRWIVAAVVAGVLVLSGAAVAAGLLLPGDGGGEEASGRSTERGADTGWAEGVTPAWMSEHLGLDSPATAQSPQATYEVTSRFDTGVLTFTLTRSEAEDYLAAHPPKGKWLEPASAQPDVPAHDFAHLGLTEPETLREGVRYGYVCPGAAEPTASPQTSGAPDTPYDMEEGYDTSEERCVRLYAHAYSPQRTRIYLRAHFEPGISPLPAAASPSPSPSTPEG